MGGWAKRPMDYSGRKANRERKAARAARKREAILREFALAREFRLARRGKGSGVRGPQIVRAETMERWKREGRRPANRIAVAR